MKPATRRLPSCNLAINLMNDLRERLAYLWQTEIATAYQTGRFANQLTLLAELYRLIQGSGYPPVEVWLQPDLHFPPPKGVIFDQLDTFQVQQWLTHQQPSLLITCEEQVVGAVELNYAPDDFIDHRPSLRRLIALARLAGRSSLHLRLDPQRGRPDSDLEATLAPDLLCVYAVIAKKDALALRRRNLHESYPREEFPPNFLHLIGAIRSQGAFFAVQ
jgi:hypothetical protein